MLYLTSDQINWLIKNVGYANCKNLKVFPLKSRNDTPKSIERDETLAMIEVYFIGLVLKFNREHNKKLINNN